MSGASQELTDALMIKPYDIEGFTASIEQAIAMPGGERQRRIRAMRRVVTGHNVFLWASDILQGLEQAIPAPRPNRGPGGTRALSPFPFVRKSPAGTDARR